MEKHVKSTMDVDKSSLDLFWRLCEKNTNVRLNACADLLHLLWKKQQEVEEDNVLAKDLQYSIERLVKGLASTRDAARLGYTLLLTEILKKFDIVQIEEVLELMKKHLIATAKEDKRDCVFGQLFAYSAIIRSGRLPNHTYLSYVILDLYDLYHGKSYILNATYEVILDIFSQLSNENFKNDVWPSLKKKLPADWGSCSAESLWMLLLCIRLFPDAVNAKYLRNHWNSEDLFASDNLEHIKRIIKQTTSMVPLVHPLCSEFLLIIKERKDFSEIWTTVVDDNLFDQKEKSFVGCEIIKLALRDSPTKKVVKTVLSPKFREMFSKTFLNTKDSMNPAANQLAEFLCNLAKSNNNPDNQILILKAFLQLPSTVLLDQVLKKKEVTLIIQNLLPDAVKTFFEILKTVLLKRKSDDNESINNAVQAVLQIGTIVAHTAVLNDIDWRMDVVRFLFLHSFFTVKETTSEIQHCGKLYEPLPGILRDTCTNTFYKALNFLHVKTENQQSVLSNFLQQLLFLTEYADQLMHATENVEPQFSVEKIQASWNHLKRIVSKLNKQGRRDGQVNESNAFQALFLQLGFFLFQDPENISEMLEELYVCCKKALKVRKQEMAVTDDNEKEPPWIGVVIDILLSLLSKSSKNLRNVVSYVFPLFFPFMDCSALQQILDVVNPQKGDDMLVEESDADDDDDQNVEFGSGSSSDGSEDEVEPVDAEFKKKIQDALGTAADASDAESVVLSDSEMFKLDDALAEVFKSRRKSGHTQITSEDKTLLHFRTRCFDLILRYLKSEPPMHLVITCIEPILSAFEYGHKGKHQSPLLQKTVSVLEFITKMRKFQNHSNIEKSEFKRLLELIIPKCHKEINMTFAVKLYSLCLFIVLCCKKLENDSDEKKSSKTPFYVKSYLSALDTFVSKESNMLPQFFTCLMGACPELSWYFIEPLKNYAFNSTTRLFKRTQCLGLLLEAMKYSKSQKDKTEDQWLQLGNSILSSAIEVLRNALDEAEIKPAYFTELLKVIFTVHSIIKDKTNQSLLEKYTDLLPLLNSNSEGKMKKLNAKGKSFKHKIIVCLQGNSSNSGKNQEIKAKKLNQKKRKQAEKLEIHNKQINGDVSEQYKKKLKKKKKDVEKCNIVDSIETDSVQSN